MNEVVKELKSQGPMLSGKLKAILVKKYNLSENAARKTISRARSPVQKIKTFSFRNNQVFVYLEEQYNTPKYRKHLYETLKKDSPSISSILIALENSCGMIRKDMLPIYSSSPVENTRGHRLFARNIQDLINAGIVIDYDEYYELSQLYSGMKIDITRARSVAVINQIVITDFVEWAQKLNLMAFNSAKTYPDNPIFAHFAWLASGPSYVYPLFANGKNGFVIADSVWKEKAGIDDVRFFVEKINIVKHFKRINKFSPILLVESLEKKALKYLKDNKIAFFVIRYLFDKNYSDTLTKVFNILVNATHIVNNDPQSLDDLIKEIRKNSGKFNNAMGVLFECMVGVFFVSINAGNLRMNIMVPNNNGPQYEIDVLVIGDDTVTVVECKAIRSHLDYEYVDKWLNTRIPCFFDWIKQNYPNLNIAFELWSLGGYVEDAEEILEERKKIANSLGYSLEYRNKNEIAKYARSQNGNKFANQLKEYFNDYGDKQQVKNKK